MEESKRSAYAVCQILMRKPLSLKGHRTGTNGGTDSRLETARTRSSSGNMRMFGERWLPHET